MRRREAQGFRDLLFESILEVVDKIGSFNQFNDQVGWYSSDEEDETRGEE